MKVKIELTIIDLFSLHSDRLKQVVNFICGKKRMPQYAHDFHDETVHFVVMLNDANEAVCDDGNMYLNADSILTLTPKGLDLEVLLDPFEEQLDLPSIFIKKRDFTSFEVKVVSVVRERSMQVWSIVNNASDRNWIVPFVPSASEPDSLVSENMIISLQQILAFFNIVIWMKLFTDNKECASLLNCEESDQIEVSSVKDVACKSFIFNPVHGIDIMNLGRGDSIGYWNLCSDVNLGVDSDAGLCGSEFSPSKNREAEINRGGVNGIESTMKLKLLCDSSLLSQADHIEGKLFKDSVIPESIGLGYDTPIGSRSSEAKMVSTFSMSGNDIYKFAKTGTARELTEYEYTKKVPMCERPAFRPVVVSADDTIELAFERRGYLLKHISSRMHICSNFDLDAKIRNSNVGHTFPNLFCCA